LRSERGDLNIRSRHGFLETRRGSTDPGRSRCRLAPAPTRRPIRQAFSSISQNHANPLQPLHRSSLRQEEGTWRPIEMALEREVRYCLMPPPTTIRSNGFAERQLWDQRVHYVACNDLLRVSPNMWAYFETAPGRRSASCTRHPRTPIADIRKRTRHRKAISLAGGCCSRILCRRDAARSAGKPGCTRRYGAIKGSCGDHHPAPHSVRAPAITRGVGCGIARDCGRKAWQTQLMQGKRRVGARVGGGGGGGGGGEQNSAGRCCVVTVWSGVGGGVGRSVSGGDAMGRR